MEPAHQIPRPLTYKSRFGLASLCALVLSLHAAAALPAQQRQVVGLVRDRETGAVLPAAQVRILDLEVTTITNSSGQFSFSGVRPGTYTIEVDYIGYPTHVVVVRLSDQSGLLIIEMERRAASSRVASKVKP